MRGIVTALRHNLMTTNGAVVTAPSHAATTMRRTRDPVSRIEVTRRTARELVHQDTGDAALGRSSLLPPEPHQPEPAPGERHHVRGGLRDAVRRSCHRG